MLGPRPYVKKLGKGFKPGRFAYNTPEENYLRDTRLRKNRVPKLEDEKKSIENYIDASVLNSLDNSVYSSEQKVAAATYYALTGNLTLASDRAEIPWDVIRRWKASAPWFMEIVDQVHKQKSEEFNAKATEIIDDCLAALVQRVQTGEEVVIQNGKVVTKALGARDLAYVLSVVFDKRQLNKGQATTIRQNSTDDMLKKLKKEFIKMAKKEEEKVIEGERVK